MKLLTWPRMLVALGTLWFAFSAPPGISVGQETTFGAAPGQSQTDSTADSVLEEVSRITGWPIRSQLKKQMVSRAEVQKYLTENMREEYTPKELHVEEATLKAFGLVPPDFDLGRFLISFYTEQAAGYYDPHRKTMCIADCEFRRPGDGAGP